MRISSHNFLFSAMAGALGLLLAASASAEQPMPGEDAMQQGQVELQLLQERLFKIQQQTFEANPGLVEQRQDVEYKAIKAMQDAGYDPEANMETLQSAQVILQDESLPEAERMQALEEAQQAQQEIQQAQQAAMQNEALVQAHQKFQENLMTAMRNEDPEVDQLIRRFQEIQQNMQGGMQPPPQ